MIYEFQLWKTHLKILSITNQTEILGYVRQRYFVSHLGLTLFVLFKKTHLYCVDYMGCIYGIEMPINCFASNIIFTNSDDSVTLEFRFLDGLWRSRFNLNLNEFKLVDVTPIDNSHSQCMITVDTNVKNEFTDDDIGFCSKTKTFVSFLIYPRTHCLICKTQTKSQNYYLIEGLENYLLISFDGGSPFVKECYKLFKTNECQSIVLCEKSGIPLIVEHQSKDDFKFRFRNL